MRFGGVFPIRVRSDEFLLNRLLQVTEPGVIWTISQTNGSAVHKGTNFAEDLNQKSESTYNLFVDYPHLDIFSVPLPWAPKEIEKIWCVFITGGFCVVHPLFSGYLTRGGGEENR